MNAPKPYFNPYDLANLANSDDYRRQLIGIQSSIFNWKRGVEDLFNVLNNCNGKYEWDYDKFTFENALAFIEGKKFGEESVYPEDNSNSLALEAYFSPLASFARVLVFAKTIHDSLAVNECPSLHNIENKIYSSLSTDDFHSRNIGKLFVHFSEFVHLSDNDRKQILNNVYNNSDERLVFGLFGIKPYHDKSTGKSECDFYKKLDSQLAELSLYFKEESSERFQSLERRIALNNVIFVKSGSYLMPDIYDVDFDSIQKDLPNYSATSENLSNKDVDFTKFILENYQKALQFEYVCNQIALEGDMEYHGVTELP